MDLILRSSRKNTFRKLLAQRTSEVSHLERWLTPRILRRLVSLQILSGRVVQSLKSNCWIRETIVRTSPEASSPVTIRLEPTLKEREESIGTLVVNSKILLRTPCSRFRAYRLIEWHASLGIWAPVSPMVHIWLMPKSPTTLCSNKESMLWDE